MEYNPTKSELFESNVCVLADREVTQSACIIILYVESVCGLGPGKSEIYRILNHIFPVSLSIDIILYPCIGFARHED